MLTRRRPDAPVRVTAARSAARPVVLATLDVPFDERAAAVGVDAAVEARVPLHVVNVVETPFLPSTLAGWDYVVRPEIEQSLRRPCEVAAGLGIAVERLRLRSPHPVAALLELVAQVEPGLLVLAPDRSRLPRRRFRRTARAIRERAACLVWTEEP